MSWRDLLLAIAVLAIIVAVAGLVVVSVRGMEHVNRPHMEPLPTTGT